MRTSLEKHERCLDAIAREINKALDQLPWLQAKRKPTVCERVRNAWLVLIGKAEIQA